MQVNVLGCAMFHSFRLVSDEKGSLKNIINIHSLFQFCMQKIDNFHFIKLGLDWWNKIIISTNKLWKKIDWFEMP